MKTSTLLNARRSFAALLVAAGTAGLAAQAPTPDADAVISLDAFTVSAATRTEKLASALPVSTTVIPTQRLADQLALSSDLGTALAQFIPGYAPSRQKLTSRGESFRGRDPLYLVDGIPQSNPLRAGSRESLTIDPFFLERIEAVHGSSAAQGLGATGGLINFITLAPPAEEGTTQRLELSGTTSTRFKSDGFGGKAAYALAARTGESSLVAGAAYEVRPFAYDGEGRPLGVDNVQGDLLDSTSLDVFAKGAHAFSSRHDVRLMVHRFELEQNADWLTVTGNRANGTPTISMPGTPAGQPARNLVTAASATFQDKALGGGELTADVFLQRFDGTYGASDTASTRNFFRVNGTPTLDQSQIEARKHGVKLTWVRTLTELGDLGIVTGADYLADQTAQVLILTGRTWVPETTYKGWSPYLQLEKPIGALTLHGGLRYEIAKLDVPDFRTIESSGNTLVAGGAPQFDEALFNLGATWRAADGVTLFGGYTQGFGMPDVGRVLRAINTPGVAIDNYIELSPIVTDNLEAGVRFYGPDWKLGWSAYLSQSDFGSRLSANSAGILSVTREETITYGTELSAEWRVGRTGTFGGNLAVQEGKSDRDGNGSVDRRLPAVNVGPAKLTLFWERPWSERISTHLQTQTLFDRDDPDGIAAGDFTGYTLVDALVTLKVPGGRMTVGVENLLDEDYVTYYSQTLTGGSANNDNYFAGRGRTLTVRYRWDF